MRNGIEGDSEVKAKINAKGMEIAVLSKGDMDDYISLTDIAKYKNNQIKHHLNEQYVLLHLNQ